MELVKCDRCGKEKDWKGSDIKCPFQESDEFSPDNWNCGMIGRVRALRPLAIEGKTPGLNYGHHEDQHWMTIKVGEAGGFYEDMGLCLWVSWYKSRGATESMWILDAYKAPRRPTFEELETITEHYNV